MRMGVLHNLGTIIKRDKGNDFFEALTTTTEAYIALARMVIRDKADVEIVLSTLESGLVKPDALYAAIKIYAAGRNDD